MSCSLARRTSSRLVSRRSPLSFRAAILAAAGAVALLAGAPAPGALADEQSESLSYRLFVGGVKVGKATVNAQMSDDAYTVVSVAETSGVVGWFFEASYETRSEGRFDGAEILPTYFDMRSVTRGDERQEMRIAYEGDAPSGVEAEPPLRERHYDIDPADQTGALDPLSAMVAALRPADAATPCGRVISVFDGRRRIEIRLGQETRRFDRRGLPHVECPASFVRVGGFKEKHMAQPDVPMTLWYALMDDGRALPARVQSDTEFGAAMAVLQNL